MIRTKAPRSYCPISLSLEVFGDTWSLLILRDMMFAGKRHFREMLQSDEQISSNILADRLRVLTEHGLITKADDPSHKQKAIYSLTENGIALLPILVQIGIWGRHHVPASDEANADLKTFNRQLELGGPALWKRLMAALRATHLAGKARSTPNSARPAR